VGTDLNFIQSTVFLIGVMVFALPNRTLNAGVGITIIHYKSLLSETYFVHRAENYQNQFPVN